MKAMHQKRRLEDVPEEAEAGTYFTFFLCLEGHSRSIRMRIPGFFFERRMEIWRVLCRRRTAYPAGHLKLRVATPGKHSFLSAQFIK